MKLYYVLINRNLHVLHSFLYSLFPEKTREERRITERKRKAASRLDPISNI